MPTADHGLGLVENLGVRPDSHFQVLRPESTCGENRLEANGLLRAWANLVEIGADLALQSAANGLGLGYVTTRLLLDHPLQEACDESHATGPDRLEVYGRQKVGFFRIQRVGRAVGKNSLQ